MGNWRIEIEAIGGHGCERQVKDGEEVYGCNRMGCPDCECRRFLKQLQQNNSIVEAHLIHWPIPGSHGELRPASPGDVGSIVDDLVTKKRAGSFSK